MKTKLSKIFILFFLLLTVSFAIVPSLALAQSTQTPQQRCDKLKDSFLTPDGVNPFSWVTSDYCTATGLMMKIINLGLALAGTVAILFIIIGGYQYLTAAGNEEQAESGQKTLTHAVIGLVVIILSFMIIRVVSNAITGDLGSTGTEEEEEFVPSEEESIAGQPLTAAITGESSIRYDQTYAFQLTATKALTNSICGGVTPTIFVAASKPSGAKLNLRPLTNDAGAMGYTGTFSVNPKIDLGYTGVDSNSTNVLAYTMTLEAYICGQFKAAKSVRLDPAPGAGPLR